MTQTRFLKTAGVITSFAAIILAGMMNNSKRVRARDDDRGDESEDPGFDGASRSLLVP
jgi:hypothetical protein